MTSPADILTFWFGKAFKHGMPVQNRNALWFSVNPKLDEQIKQRFGAAVEKASQGHYEHWEVEPEGRLALITLLDQFPRNIYRGSKNAFAYDDAALKLCLEGLERGHDQVLMPVYRSFFYLPLEHSESLSLQKRCVELFTTFHATAEPAIQTAIKENLDYAQLHYEIIERFGRFPHRNALLGRPSSPEEIAYLEDSGVNFGQNA